MSLCFLRNAIQKKKIFNDVSHIKPFTLVPAAHSTVPCQPLLTLCVFVWTDGPCSAFPRDSTRGLLVPSVWAPLLFNNELVSFHCIITCPSFCLVPSVDSSSHILRLFSQHFISRCSPNIIKTYP